MATISISDIIYATVVRRGTTLITVKLSGIASLHDLLARLRREISRDTTGLVTLILRNGSQGWSRSHRLLLTPGV